MKKKALSFDEKRARLLAIFHEKVLFTALRNDTLTSNLWQKEVFNLKELEKLGAKAGIGFFSSSSLQPRQLTSFSPSNRQRSVRQSHFW